MIFDVAVVGAGPAGALTAGLLAHVGARVALIDRAYFPRSKVCGSCLHPRALAALERVGLGHLPRELGAVRLNELDLRVGSRRLSVPLPGVALSRSALDHALVLNARENGAELFLGFLARLPAESAADVRIVELEGPAKIELQARVVIDASGLGGSLTRREAPRSVARGARIGCGTVISAAAVHALPRGVVAMACGRAGYAGAVVLENGELDVACAFDAAALKNLGPAALAQELFQSTGLELQGALRGARWCGTPALTRSAAQPAARRLFLVGDAAGYVEPFTGEGIAWALDSAHALVPHVGRALARADWDASLEQDWSRDHARRLRAGHRRCRRVAALLRRPRLVAALVGVLGRAPRVSAQLHGALAGRRIAGELH